MDYIISPLCNRYGAVIETQDKRDILALDKSVVAHQFTQSSLVLVRGFDIDPERFRRFTAQFGSDFHTYAGGHWKRRKIDGVSDHMEVTPGTRMVVPHGELTYTASSPRILWFYCRQPADTGGETTVYDGIEYLAALPQALRGLLQDHRLEYTTEYPESRWPDLFETAELAEVERVCQESGLGYEVRGEAGSRVVRTRYVCSAILRSRVSGASAFVNYILSSLGGERLGFENVAKVRLEGGQPLPEKTYEELMAVGEQVVTPVAWREGDVLMIDNTRFMHGRRSFTGARDVHLRMCRKTALELEVRA